MPLKVPGVVLSIRKPATATDNGAGILMVGSSGNRISGNTATQNTRFGIVAFDGSNGNKISGNRTSENLLYGINIDGANDNKVTGNTANRNGAGGILLVNSVVSVGPDVTSGNIVRGNRAYDNGELGIVTFAGPGQGLPTENLIQANTAFGNPVGDLAESDPACGNTWKNNSFGTELSTPGCID